MDKDPDVRVEAIFVVGQQMADKVNALANLNLYRSFLDYFCQLKENLSYEDSCFF